jgi:hypothetical protein
MHAGASAAAGDPPPQSALEHSAAARPVVRFRFNAGAPLLAPAGVGADGLIVVGTADGYVHALHADGSYDFSLTVHGAVSHAPLVTPALVFVATSADRIYAITREGTVAWVFAAPAGIESELALGSSGLTYFLGRDRHLYGVTVHGSVALRLPTGDVSAGPIVAKDGAVWLGTSAGDLLKPGLAGSVHVPLGAPVNMGLSVDGALYWLAGQELVRTADSGSVRYRVSGIARTAGPASVTTQGDCLWLDDAGKAIERLSPCARPGARPALGPNRELLLPTDDGGLSIATPNGITRITIAASRVLTPIWSNAAQQVIACAREGLVVGVELAGLKLKSIGGHPAANSAM